MLKSFKKLWAAMVGLYALPAVGGGYQIGDGNLNEISLYTLPDPPVKTVATTLTAAEFTGGLVINTFGSALALTTPTGAQLDALLVNARVGSAFLFTMVGTAAFANTLTGGTGVTVVGAAATPATTIASAQFLVRKTGVATYTAYRIS